MKPNKLILCASLLAALALPVASVAQTQGAGSQPPVAGQRHHGGFMRAMQNLNLSADQKSKIEAIVAQFHQAHPRGSTPDPQAAQAMHDQVMAILTPAQQAQLKANMAQRQNTAERNDNGASGENSEQQGAGRGNRMMQRFDSLNLSDQQKTQIQNLIAQYRQAHPKGSTRDPQAAKALRDQIFNVLTPQQQAQFKAEMSQREGGQPPNR